MQKLIETINDLSAGYEVYAVGGFARDMFLGMKPGDIDLAVNKDAPKFAKKLSKILDAKLVVLDEAGKIYRIILKPGDAVGNIDVSLFGGKTIESDLRKRDFTVNAAAFRLSDFDNFSKHMLFANAACVKDFKAKIINMVSPSAFVNDPLRMLRAFRFSAELGFTISGQTLSRIKKDAKLIKKSAPERIKNEFFRVLSSDDASAMLALMDKTRLLSAIFPEIIDMKKANKKYYYHPGGLFQHSFETMSSAENILNNLGKFFPDSFADMKAHFADNKIFSQYVTRAGMLKFSALFHDIAKPCTATKEGNKMRFFGHEEEGAKKLKESMSLLRMSKQDAAYASFLVENHMRPSTLTKNNTVTKRAALKLFRDAGDNTPDLLVLAMADWHSYKSLKVFSKKGLSAQEKAARRLIKDYFELKNAKPLEKLIDGNIIMKEFSLKPGPWLGELLNSVREAQQEGKVKDAKEALKLVSSKLTKIKKKYNIYQEVWRA